MKQQLMIAAIIGALSGAAFAATEGTHTINLTVAPSTSSTLEFTAPAGIFDEATEWDFDTDKRSGTNDFHKSLGTFRLTGSGFTTENTCFLTMTSGNTAWELRIPGTNSGIKYGIGGNVFPRLPNQTGHTYAKGYSSHSGINYQNPSPNIGASTQIDATSHTCDANISAYLVTEPFPTSTPRPAVGVYTDTVNFTVSAY